MSDRNNPYFIRRMRNVLDEPRRVAIYEFLNTPGWETGWKSHSKSDGLTFLHKHYAGRRKGSDEPQPCEEELRAYPLIHDMWLSLKQHAFFKDRTLVRCYANGMSYGMDGTVHTDARNPGSFTLVYYPHDRWSPNWGGETMFYTPEEDGLVAATYPEPNTAVLFDGRVPHRANGVTRSYSGVRITLMFKIEVTKSNAPEPPAISA
jgi:SM-20-related protein